MTWNYRVIKTESNGNPHFGIYEVYYSEDGKLEGYTSEPVPVEWDDGESGAEELEWMRKALDHPVLTPSDFSLTNK